jgi:hypothetical protein
MRHKWKYFTEVVELFTFHIYGCKRCGVEVKVPKYQLLAHSVRKDVQDGKISADCDFQLVRFVIES